ncbi:MAG: hypothetical protein AAGA81_23170 [Acidobacteriota bacterium]
MSDKKNTTSEEQVEKKKPEEDTGELTGGELIDVSGGRPSSPTGGGAAKGSWAPQPIGKGKKTGR